MDIEEFEKKVQPGAKRSRLEPFQVQIFELKSKKYTNLQIREWLAANGVNVSQEAVRKFINSREGTEQKIAHNTKQRESTEIGLHKPNVLNDASDTSIGLHNPIENEAEYEQNSQQSKATFNKADAEKKASKYLGKSISNFNIDSLVTKNKDVKK